MWGGSEHSDLPPPQSMYATTGLIMNFEARGSIECGQLNLKLIQSWIFAAGLKLNLSSPLFLSNDNWSWLYVNHYHFHSFEIIKQFLDSIWNEKWAELCPYAKLIFKVLFELNTRMFYVFFFISWLSWFNITYT